MSIARLNYGASFRPVHFGSATPCRRYRPPCLSAEPQSRTGEEQTQPREILDIQSLRFSRELPARRQPPGYVEKALADKTPSKARSPAQSLARRAHRERSVLLQCLQQFSCIPVELCPGHLVGQEVPVEACVVGDHDDTPAGPSHASAPAPAPTPTPASAPSPSRCDRR